MFPLSVARAMAIAQVGHLLLGWMGTRRLLRNLGCSEAGAILGAIAWGFGGVWISSTHFLPVFFAWAWIPWLAAGAAEIPATLGGAVRDSFFGALLLLIGEPVTALAGALAYVAVFFRNPVTKQRSRRALVTAAFSIGMAAVTLIPGAALARKSVRATGIDDAIADDVLQLSLELGPVETGRAVGQVLTEEGCAAGIELPVKVVLDL